MKIRKNGWLLFLALGILLPGCASHRARNTSNSYARERVVGEVRGEGPRKIPVTEVHP